MHLLYSLGLKLTVQFSVTDNLRSVFGLPVDGMIFGDPATGPATTPVSVHSLPSTKIPSSTSLKTTPSFRQSSTPTVSASSTSSIGYFKSALVGSSIGAAAIGIVVAALAVWFVLRRRHTAALRFSASKVHWPNEWRGELPGCSQRFEMEQNSILRLGTDSTSMAGPHEMIQHYSPQELPSPDNS